VTIGQLVALLRVDTSAFMTSIDVARRMLGTFGKGFGSFATTALSMGAKAAAGLAGVTVGLQTIAGLVGTVAAAGPALAVLPAVLGAVKLATAAVTVGMQGFGDAMSAIASGDAAAFAEAVGKLAPQAQEAARAVQSLKPAWDSLQLEVQNRLFAETGTRIASLGGAYLPILRENLSGVAELLNSAAHDVADFFSDAEVQGDVGEGFALLRESIGNVTPAIGPVVEGLYMIGRVGADFLPGLTAGASDAAAAFREWVGEARASGQLHEWISQALSVLGDLGTIAGNVGSILGGIFSAASASGGGFLQTVMTITGSIAEMVNSAAGQEVLGSLFAMGTQIAQAFMSVLSALLPAVAPLIPLVAQLATTIGTGLAQVLIAIMPAVSALVTALVSSLQPVLPVIAGLFTQLAGVLGPLAMTLVSALAPVLPVIVNVFTQLVGIVAPLVAQLAGVLAPILPQIANLFMLLVQAAMPLLPPLAQLISAILPPLGAILSGVVIPAIQLVIGILGAWWGVLAVGLTIVAGFATSVSQFFTNLMTTVGSIVSGIVNFIVTGFMNARDLALNAFSAMVSGVSGFIGDLLGFVGSIPGRILDALGDLGSLLVESGRSLIDGFLGGLKSAWDTVVSWAKGAMEWLRGFWPFSPAKRGAFSGSGYVTHSGKALTSDFAQSLRAGMPTVVGAARDVMSATHLAMTPALDARSTGLPGNGWLSRAGDRGGASADQIASAVGSAVHRALDGARMDVDGRGVARIVNRQNLRDNRRGAGGFAPVLSR
jgi:phage-related protein